MNAIYPKYKEGVIQGAATTSLAGSGTSGVYAALVDTALYTYSAADQFYSSIAAAIVGTPVELASKTYVNGLFDAADSTFVAVSGASCEAIVLYVRNSSVLNNSKLLCYIDSGVAGLPVTPNGGDIGVIWNAAGIIQF